jgi:hypothetical protein
MEDFGRVDYIKKTRRGDEWGQFGVNHHFWISEEVTLN